MGIRLNKLSTICKIFLPKNDKDKPPTIVIKITVKSINDIHKTRKYINEILNVRYKIRQTNYFYIIIVVYDLIIVFLR